MVVLLKCETVKKPLSSVMEPRKSSRRHKMTPKALEASKQGLLVKKRRRKTSCSCDDERISDRKKEKVCESLEYTPEKNGEGGEDTCEKNGEGADDTSKRSGEVDQDTCEKNGGSTEDMCEKNGEGGEVTCEKGEAGKDTSKRNGEDDKDTVEKNGEGAEDMCGNNGEDTSKRNGEDDQDTSEENGATSDSVSFEFDHVEEFVKVLEEEEAFSTSAEDQIDDIVKEKEAVEVNGSMNEVQPDVVPIENGNLKGRMELPNHSF